MIKITQDITTEPVSISDVRQWIKHEDADETEELSLITDLIKGVRVHIENRAGLALAEKTIVEYFDRDESNNYTLSVAPVISVDSVELLDLEEDSTALTLNSDYYLTGLYERRILYSGLSNTQTLKVTYKAGYGDTETETLPYDIKQAVLRQALQWYDNRSEFVEGKFLNSVGDIINSYKRSFF